MTDRPLVRLPEKPLCLPHFYELIPQEHPSGTLWQSRYAIAMIKLTELALADPRIQKQCRGKVEMATAILAQCVPICCFLGPKALAEVKADLARRFPVIE